MNQRETIDGIPGEWRTVTKASEVTVGQRVRYHHNKKFGYKTDPDKTNCGVQKIVSKNGLAVYAGRKDTNESGNLFNGYWKNVQAFFPLADKQKRKVAKRPSKHERLLKALLKSGCVMDAIAQAGLAGVISNQQHNELIAIKERMEKGAKV
jgi:hypothetical protein